MSGEQHITIVGRLTGDPELRFTPSGAPVANLTIASNARRYDKATDGWKDESANFWRCNAWRDLAENVAESLQKGSPVVAFGEVKTREYTTKDGEKRSAVEVELSAIGPDLRWVTAKTAKAQRGQGAPAPTARDRADDPWATSAPNPVAHPAYDEPPF